MYHMIQNDKPTTYVMFEKKYYNGLIIFEYSIGHNELKSKITLAYELLSKIVFLDIFIRV